MSKFGKCLDCREPIKENEVRHKPLCFKCKKKEDDSKKYKIIDGEKVQILTYEDMKPSLNVDVFLKKYKRLPVEMWELVCDICDEASDNGYEVKDTLMCEPCCKKITRKNYRKFKIAHQPTEPTKEDKK